MVVRVPMRVSDEQLSLIGEANPGWRVELVDGEIVMSPTNGDAGRRNATLTLVLGLWAEAHGYTAFDSSTGFRVASDSVLSPDHALIANARWDALSPDERRRFGPTPDVVVELMSAPDERRGTVEKCERWHAVGASFVVLLDPFASPHVCTRGTAPPEFPADWSKVLA